MGLRLTDELSRDGYPRTSESLPNAEGPPRPLPFAFGGASAFSRAEEVPSNPVFQVTPPLRTPPARPDGAPRRPSWRFRRAKSVVKNQPGCCRLPQAKTFGLPALSATRGGRGACPLQRVRGREGCWGQARSRSNFAAWRDRRGVREHAGPGCKRRLGRIRCAALPPGIRRRNCPAPRWRVFSPALPGQTFSPLQATSPTTAVPRGLKRAFLPCSKPSNPVLKHSPPPKRPRGSAA